MTPAQTKLLRALVHGMSSPEEVLATALSPELKALFEPLVGEHDESLDFRAAYDALSAKPTIEQLVISDRVDLSELELAYLFRLAELGTAIRFELLTDDTGQGLSLPTTQLAARIEKRHDLKNIEVVFKPFSKPKAVYRFEAPDLVHEARWVAASIPKTGSVAVAMRTLDRRALIFEDMLGLKIMALPDLMGQKFDHVFVVDCAHGRLTVSKDPDWPLKDSDIFEINRALGRQVLRRFEEDLLEPSMFSPRQALEPMWFLGACDAARESLCLSSSLLDDRYQAQVTHELVKLLPSKALPPEPSPASLREAPSPPVERAIATLRERFPHKLGLLADKPLSPTRIEAFARCAFRALIEQVLDVNLSPDKGVDLDARIIGGVAHKILAGEATLEQESARILLEHPEINPKLWNAWAAWLATAIKRLKSNLAKNPPLPAAEPVAFEKKLGPMPVKIGEDTIYLGGIADRIDQSPETQVVIDYKLSSITSLKMRFAPKEILKTHFQIPIYLKLIGGELGYAVSIRDGAPGPVIDMTDRFEELDQALAQLLTPILRGEIWPNAETCKDCSLKRLCRRYD